MFPKCKHAENRKQKYTVSQVDDVDVGESGGPLRGERAEERVMPGWDEKREKIGGETVGKAPFIDEILPFGQILAIHQVEHRRDDEQAAETDERIASDRA